jgi:hypothetical protein
MTDLVLLNFSHPLTAEHLARVTCLADQVVEQVIDVEVQIEPERSLPNQIAEIVDWIGLDPQEWQARPILVNPPNYVPAAVALLAELHGRMGYFATLLWIRPVPGSTPRRFQVAEIVDLQSIRDRARSCLARRDSSANTPSS